MYPQCVFVSAMCVMCFHGSLSESVYLHVPTFETQQLHQSSLLPPLISHHPTLCSPTEASPLLPPSLLLVSLIYFRPQLHPFFALPSPQPPSFTSLPSSPSSLSGSLLYFCLGDGPKLGSPLLSAPAGLLHPQTLQASCQNSPLAFSSSNHEQFFHLFSLPLLLSSPYPLLVWIFCHFICAM